MAALPQDNTPRFFLDYSCGGKNHTAVVRFSGATSPSAFGDTMNAFLNTIDSLLYQITITQVRFAASGTNVTNPVTSGIEGNTYGSDDPLPVDLPVYLRFQGRSSGGHKVSFDLFNLKGVDSSFRITTAENADVDAAVDILNGEATLFSAIDGVKAIWKPYVNVKQSSYWVKRLRSS